MVETNSRTPMVCSLNQWQCLKSMDNNRINYKIFELCEQNAGQRCKTWKFRINTMLRDTGVIINDVSNYRVLKDQVAEFLFSRFKSEWSADINRVNARNGNGRNKLRTYRQYKRVQIRNVSQMFYVSGP